MTCGANWKLGSFSRVPFRGIPSQKVPTTGPPICKRCASTASGVVRSAEFTSLPVPRASQDQLGRGVSIGLGVLLGGSGVLTTPILISL